LLATTEKNLFGGQQKEMLKEKLFPAAENQKP